MTRLSLITDLPRRIRVDLGLYLFPWQWTLIPYFSRSGSDFDTWTDWEIRFDFIFLTVYAKQRMDRSRILRRTD